MKINLQPAKRQLESMKCPEHNCSPMATISGETIKLSGICCESFKKKLESKTEELIKEAAVKAVDDEIRNIFK